MTINPGDQVETAADLAQAPEEFRNAVEKIVISHAVKRAVRSSSVRRTGDCAGADPLFEMADCRVAMEEYGHHVRFKELGEEIASRRNVCRPATIKTAVDLRVPLQTWEEFCVINCSPTWRKFSRSKTLPSALFCRCAPVAHDHARGALPRQFGKDFCTELCETEEGRKAVQDAINRYYPILPKFFGRPQSKNKRNLPEMGYQTAHQRRYACRLRKRAQEVVAELGLTLPDISESAA